MSEFPAGEYSGDWNFWYGSRRRTALVDTSTVFVRAGSIAATALRSLRYSPVDRRGISITRGLFDNALEEGESEDRRRRMLGYQRMASVREGAWVPVPASDVEDAFGALARSGGVLGLPLGGARVRLLTGTVFCLLEESLSPERVQSLLHERGLVLKGMLPFDRRAVVAQVAPAGNGWDDPFVGLRRLLAENSIEGLQRIEPVFLEDIQGRWRPSTSGIPYDQQWHLHNPGRNGGVLGADIHAERAWDRTRGGGSRIALIDNGLNLDHPDLKSAISGGGWFEDRGIGPAWFVELTQENRGRFPPGDHGTACAGMAAARPINNGVCGAAPEAELLAIGCMGDQLGSQVTLARAIAYAANPSTELPGADPKSGADVISCSLGPNTPDWELSTPLDLAIEFANKQGRGGKGAAVVWACTNGYCNIDQDEVVSHPLVLSVSRSNHTDFPDGAGYGHALSCVAPGVDVLTTHGLAGHRAQTGCSFAAPLVAGVAALALAVRPALSAEELRQRLMASCDCVGPLPYVDRRNILMGYGRINAERSVA